MQRKPQGQIRHRPGDDGSADFIGLNERTGLAGRAISAAAGDSGGLLVGEAFPSGLRRSHTKSTSGEITDKRVTDAIQRAIALNTHMLFPEIFGGSFDGDLGNFGEPLSVLCESSTKRECTREEELGCKEIMHDYT